MSRNVQFLGNNSSAIARRSDLDFTAMAVMKLLTASGKE